MLRTIFIGITALLMVVCVPVTLLEPMSESEDREFLLIVYPDEDVEDKTDIVIDLKTETGVMSVPLEDYLVGVVLSEMPASFELEALKAQAVAARTFAMRQMRSGKHDDCDLCSVSSCCQAWTSRSAIENKLGDSFSDFWNKGTRAVYETKGKVIVYNDELIDAVYFSCSGGRTEDAVEVWGNEIPYLRSVDSPGEEHARVYASEVNISLEAFSNTMKSLDSSIYLGENVSDWLGPVERTSGGGIKTIEIGGIKVAGTQMRRLFGLRSTNFSISIKADEIVFSVLGNGHRVGMSQYGANAMAMLGKTYEEIIEFYYSGVCIKKYP